VVPCEVAGEQAARQERRRPTMARSPRLLISAAECVIPGRASLLESIKSAVVRHI
jgi:hypothetical protein